jgi:hypothetical protein
VQQAARFNDLRDGKRIIHVAKFDVRAFTATFKQKPGVSDRIGIVCPVGNVSA